MVYYKKDSKAEQYYQLRKKLHEESLRFYGNFKFPVAFHVGVKEVLSGLSESSMGNGQRRNSKIHIILDEDLSDDRLKRTKGEFLCSQQKRYGNWSGQNDEQYYSYLDRETKFVPAVTCQECLKKAQRFQENKTK